MKPAENLLNYIKAHPNKEIRKALHIYEEFGYDITISNQERKKFFIDVPSESGNGSYEVELNILTNDLHDDCECPAYEEYGQCKHCVAAAIFLLNHEFDHKTSTRELLQENDKGDKYMMELEKFNPSLQLHVVQKQTEFATTSPEPEWRSFELRQNLNWIINELSGQHWKYYDQLKRISLSSFDENPLHWKFIYKEKKLSCIPEIKYNRKKVFHYRCTCMAKARYRMCLHVRIAFENLLTQHGDNYFETLRDWMEEKNAMLAPYGLTIDDEESKDFLFSISHYGELQMKAPESFIRPNDTGKFKKLYQSLKVNNANTSAQVLRPKPFAGTLIDFETGFVFNNNSQRLQIGFELEPAKVYRRQGFTDVKKLSLNQPANLSSFSELSDEVYVLLLQLSDEKLIEHLTAQGHGYIKNHGNPWQHTTHQTQELLKKQYVSCLQSLWPHLAENHLAFLLKEGKFSRTNCRPVRFAKEAAELSFVVSANEKFITVKLVLVIDGKAIDNHELLHRFLFLVNGALHILKNHDDLPVLEEFRHGYVKLPVEAKADVIKNIVAPLQERYPVQMPESFSIKTLKLQPQAQVMLKEFNEQYLMLQAEFIYEDQTVEFNHRPEDLVSTLQDGSMQIIQRDVAFEKAFFEQLRSLHSIFAQQRQNDFFYVHFNEVMKGAWFLKTVRHLQENDIVVKGVQDLKRFRYNTHPPKWEMKAGSGIDWFDLQIKISFGEQEVPLKGVRNAI
ncbi:MAG: hypothetical protein M3Y85_00350, partial [Bacteroidota bacterium]|nr:hypothetical protein [Bacteroidota bacterium]